MNPKILKVGVSIYMPVAMYTRLKEVSHERRQSLTGVIRDLIEKGLKQKKHHAVEPSKQITRKGEMNYEETKRL